MCLSCASAGITQTLISGLVQIYKRDETFNANEIANVVLGALVAVTGCCPFINPPFALIIGGRFTISYLMISPTSSAVISPTSSAMISPISCAITVVIVFSGRHKFVVVVVVVVITVAVYHLGCYIIYFLKLHDGARVFPVHGMW